MLPIGNNAPVKQSEIYDFNCRYSYLRNKKMNQREKGDKNSISKPKIGRLPRKILLLFCLSLLLAIATANISLVQAQQPIFLAAEQNEEAYDKPESFAEVIANYEKLDGLFTIYRDGENNKLLMEVKPEQIDKNYLCFVTLNSGIGSGLLIRGMPSQRLRISMAPPSGSPPICNSQHLL